VVVAATAGLPISLGTGRRIGALVGEGGRAVTDGEPPMTYLVVPDCPSLGSESNRAARCPGRDGTEAPGDGAGAGARMSSASPGRTPTSFRPAWA